MIFTLRGILDVDAPPFHEGIPIGSFRASAKELSRHIYAGSMT
jgi:hypothetical protein